MSPAPDELLEAWITTRRKIPKADLSHAVMQAIQVPPRPVSRPARVDSYPFMPFVCLFAGVGKVALILYLTF